MKKAYNIGFIVGIICSSITTLIENRIERYAAIFFICILGCIVRDWFCGDNENDSNDYLFYFPGFICDMRYSVELVFSSDNICWNVGANGFKILNKKNGRRRM